MARRRRLGGRGLPLCSSPGGPNPAGPVDEPPTPQSVAFAAPAVVVRAVEAVLVGSDDRDLEADVAAVEVVADVRDARVVGGVAVGVGGRLGIGLVDGTGTTTGDRGQVDPTLARRPDAGVGGRGPRRRRRPAPRRGRSVARRRSGCRSRRRWPRPRTARRRRGRGRAAGRTGRARPGSGRARGSRAGRRACSWRTRSPRRRSRPRAGSDGRPRACRCR